MPERRPGMKEAAIAAGLAAAGGLAVEHLSRSEGQPDKPTTVDVRHTPKPKGERVVRTRVDSGLSPEEQRDRAEDFAGAIASELSETFPNMSAEVQPDGTIKLHDPAYAVELTVTAQGNSWKVSTDRETVEWFKGHGVALHDFVVSDPSEIVNGVQDAEALSSLRQQGMWVAHDESGFGNMLSGRLGEEQTATEAAESRAQEQAELEEKKVRLASDIDYTLNEGSNVFSS